MLVMRLLVYISCFICLFGCHRAMVPQASVQTSVTDSVVITQKRIDTSVAIPGSTIEIDSLPFTSISVIDTSTRIGSAELTIEGHDGILKVICKADSLQKVISLLQEQITNTKTTVKDSTIVVTQTVKVPVTKTPAIMWWSLGLNVLALICLYYTFNIKILSSISWVFDIIKKLKF